jgi:uncharacterized membrane protein
MGWVPGADLRPAVLIAIVLGLVISLKLPPQVEPLTRIITYWDTFIVVMLIAEWRIIARSNAEHCRMRAQADDPGNIFILSVSIFGSVIGLAGAIASIRNPDPTMQRLGDWGLFFMVFIAVVGGWFLMQTSYTLHYPRIYYAGGDKGVGLNFPDDSDPDDGDFAYFAFGVGMTFQVADVAVTSRRMRRVVLKHSLFSFWYNLAIIALLINIVAGRI